MVKMRARTEKLLDVANQNVSDTIEKRREKLQQYGHKKTKEEIEAMDPAEREAQGYVRGTGGGWLKKFAKGNQMGKFKGHNYAGVIKMARAYSPQAMANIVDLATNSRDPKVRFAANKEIIERAWGKAKEPTDKELQGGGAKLDLAAVLKLASMDELQAIKSLFSRMKVLQDEADANAADQADVETEQLVQEYAQIMPPEDIDPDDKDADEFARAYLGDELGGGHINDGLDDPIED